MFSASADLYDIIYSGFKNYPEETGKVAGLIRRVHPGARTVLDIACGTGEHARLLSQDHGFAVDGIDLDSGLLAIAARKNPAGNFDRADMISFDLGTRYDVVTCLFSSIGYAGTSENLRSALACFRRHLAPGGVAIVEPWFPPGVLSHGRVSIRSAGTGEMNVCRMSHVTVEGRRPSLRFDYLIGTAAGITHATETHELGLFTVEEMLAGFADAGLSASYDPAGIADRGLYIATIAE